LDLRILNAYLIPRFFSLTLYLDDPKFEQDKVSPHSSSSSDSSEDKIHTLKSRIVILEAQLAEAHPLVSKYTQLKAPHQKQDLEVRNLEDESELLASKYGKLKYPTANR
jgi:hypothetical protein